MLLFRTSTVKYHNQSSKAIKKLNNLFIQKHNIQLHKNRLHAIKHAIQFHSKLFQFRIVIFLMVVLKSLMQLNQLKLIMIIDVQSMEGKLLRSSSELFPENTGKNIGLVLSSHRKYKFLNMYQINMNQQSSQAYSLSWYRYVNLLVFMLGALTNSIPTQTFAGINSIVAEKFQFSPLVTTLNSLCFPLLHPVMAFPSAYILDRYGLRNGCCLGGVIVVLGVWLRTTIQIDQPALCLLGSIISAVGNVFFLNSVSIIANNWFPSQMIGSIIFICSLCNLISITVGAAAPGLFISQNSSIQDIQSFLMWEAIILSVTMGLAIIFLRDRPQNPPSRSAQLKRTHGIPPYFATLVKLMKNTEYVKIFLAMMFCYGSLISYISNFNQFLHSFKFQNPAKMVSLYTLATTITGILSTLLLSYKIKQTLEYRLLAKLCLGGIIILFVLEGLYMFCEVREIWVFGVIGATSGVFRLPVISLFIAYASEVIFPEGEGAGTTYLYAGSQFFGFLMGLFSVSLIDQEANWKLFFVIILHVISMGIAYFCNHSTKQILKRTIFERQNQPLLQSPDKLENHSEKQQI